MDSPDNSRMRDCLRQVAAGSLTVEAALAQLAAASLETTTTTPAVPPVQAAPEAAAAILDFERLERCGFPEIVYGESKTAEQMLAIVAAFAERGEDVLITRLAAAAAETLSARFPDAEHDPLARTWIRRHGAAAVEPSGAATTAGTCGVITAGTSDLPMAREALNTLRFLGYPAELVVDVGVAGLHRLLDRLADLRRHRVLIVVAGMEGALPSVVGGLVACPVIAVPTSVGYGANFGGVSALLGMLNSCASGVTVTNIDAGFVAACAAARILRGDRLAAAARAVQA